MALLDTLHIPRNRSLIASNDSSDSANDLSLYFGLKSMAHNGLGHPVLLPVPRKMRRFRSFWTESGCTLALEDEHAVVVGVLYDAATDPAVTRDIETNARRDDCC